MIVTCDLPFCNFATWPFHAESVIASYWSLRQVLSSHHAIMSCRVSQGRRPICKLGLCTMLDFTFPRAAGTTCNGSTHTRPPLLLYFYNPKRGGCPHASIRNTWDARGSKSGCLQLKPSMPRAILKINHHLNAEALPSAGKGHAEAFTYVGSWGVVPFRLVAPCLCQLRDLFFSFLLACRVAALHTCRASVT